MWQKKKIRNEYSSCGTLRCRELERLLGWLTTGLHGDLGDRGFLTTERANGKNSGKQVHFPDKLRAIQWNYNTDSKRIVMDKNQRNVRLISGNGMFEVRELIGNCNSYQVQDQISYERREVENVYVNTR